MDVDLKRIADRLSAAAERCGGLQISASSSDLILSKDGFGTGRSEAVPFAAIFLRADEDAIGKALDRLAEGEENAPVA